MWDHARPCCVLQCWGGLQCSCMAGCHFFVGFRDNELIILTGDDREDHVCASGPEARAYHVWQLLSGTTTSWENSLVWWGWNVCWSMAFWKQAQDNARVLPNPLWCTRLPKALDSGWKVVFQYVYCGTDQRVAWRVPLYMLRDAPDQVWFLPRCDDKVAKCGVDKAPTCNRKTPRACIASVTKWDFRECLYLTALVPCCPQFIYFLTLIVLFSLVVMKWRYVV